MGVQKFHITLSDLEFNLPSKTKIEPNLLLKQLRYYYIDAKVFGLYGVRNVIAPKGQ